MKKSNFTGTGPDFPETALASEDDEQVKAVVMRYGITELLDAEAVRRLPPGVADITMYAFGTHPTHWLLLARFDGSLNPADNGYALWGWPKTFFPLSEANEEADFIISFLSRKNPGAMRYHFKPGSDFARMPGQ